MPQFTLETLVKDRSVRIALKKSLEDDGRLSDSEVMDIIASAFDGGTMRKQEFEDLQTILKKAKTLSAVSRQRLDIFSRALYTPETKPAKPALPSADHLTTNFKLSEFACKDGTAVPSEYLANVKELAKNLQILRDKVGVSIRVNSSYRTPTHNAKVGGKPNSQHKYAKAADIVVSGMSSSKVATLIETMITNKQLKQGGVGRYNTFTHYDIRGTRARWG